MTYLLVYQIFSRLTFYSYGSTIWSLYKCIKYVLRIIYLSKTLDLKILYSLIMEFIRSYSFVPIIFSRHYTEVML